MIEIEKIFKGKFSLDEKLAKHSSYRIGGPADYYLEPIDTTDVLNILNYLKKNELNWYLLGNGSNILISDEGIRGFVINLEKGFSYLKHEDSSIIAGSGVKLAKFVDFCIQNSYSGVETLAGIPATLGGALVMNAGCYGSEISTYVSEVTLIKCGKLKVLKNEDCGFIYRNSRLWDSIILEAKFNLPVGNVEDLINTRKEFLLKRNDSQPVEIPSAGCVFKNPKGNSAAKLIEECGLKGKKYGGAMVSSKHANFIVNFDNASANDVIELIKIVKKSVKEKFNIVLELEIKLVGFENKNI